MLFAIVLLALAVPYLLDKGYWVADAEVLVFSAACAAFATLFGALGARLPWMRRVLLAFLVCVFIDLYFTNGAWIALACFAIALVVLHSRFEINFYWMTCAFSAVFLSAALLVPKKPVLLPALGSIEMASGSIRSELPPIVHLIFDEHGSLTALPKTIVSADVSNRMMQDYVDRGFAVFPNTRSTSGSTQISLSRLLSLSDELSPARNNFSIARNELSFEVLKNHYVDALVVRGYEVEIIQSSYLGLCNPENATCHTYSRADHGNEMRQFPDRLVDRLVLVLVQLHLDLLRSDSVHNLAAYRLFAPLTEHLPTKRNYWTRPAAMLSVMDDMERHLGSAPLRGRAHIAHIMLPHFPYVFSRDCGLNARSEWVVPDWSRGVDGGQFQPDHVLNAYWSQLACLHARSLRIVDAVLRNPEGQNAIFFIHGDHGVRLVDNARAPTLDEIHSTSPQQALDALFVVRAPGLTASVDSTPDLLQRRFPRIFYGTGLGEQQQE
jgi:hypothetical protein